MIVQLALLAAALPFAIDYWREHKRAPSVQWPLLAKALSLRYDAAPPRLSGNWNGRRVAAESGPAGVTLTAWLAAATSLRVECGPAELVAKRAGLVVQDPVEALDPAFRAKLLARCSVKAAGPTVFDAGMQRRLAALPGVDFTGEDTRVVWTAPALKDPDSAEALLGVLCAVADGLERFPRGGTPHA